VDSPAPFSAKAEADYTSLTLVGPPLDDLGLPPEDEDEERYDRTIVSPPSITARAPEDAGDTPHLLRQPEPPKLQPRRRPVPQASTTGARQPLRPSSGPSRPPSVRSRPPSSLQPAIAAPRPTKAQLESKVTALRSLSIDHAPDSQRPVTATRSAKLPWILIALVLAGFGFLEAQRRGILSIDLPGLGQAKTDPSNQTARKIETLHATARAGQTLIAAGYIAAKDPITVGVTISGRVKKVLVQNGDQVKRGQTMVQLEDAQLIAQLRLAQAKERDAQRNLSRVRTLSKAEAATASDLENAIGRHEIAQAERTVIGSLLEESRVRAPTDGTVVEVLAHPGEVFTVAPNTTAGVVRFADLRLLVAELDVNEADVGQVRIGQQVELNADAQAGKKYQGKVFEIAQQADRARGTVLVRADVVQADGHLKPGMAVRGTFLAEPDAKPRLLIPRASVDQGAVWLVENGKAVRRTIATEPMGPNALEVREGLSEGQQIVVEGWQGLHDGDAIAP
jgi:membrane fusion protein, multidrug efflux system